MRRLCAFICYIAVLFLLAGCSGANAPDMRGEGTLLYAANPTSTPAVQPTPAQTPEASPSPAPEPAPPADPIPYAPEPTPPPLVIALPELIENNAAAAEGYIYHWQITPRPGGIPPTGTHTAAFLRPFSALYRGPENNSVFLTFELAYEAGHTEAVLDILREWHIPAAFFVTLPYVENNADLVERMGAEGHVIGLLTHNPLPFLSDAGISEEMLYPSRHFSTHFVHPIDPFLRPAAGAYSEHSLGRTRHYGFFTLFWSALHYDWAQAVDSVHPGMVLSLQGMSTANTAALPGMLAGFQQAGFFFISLYGLI
ncbi:MAG: polysaccharide deacetylase family protein [Defluviitaleaceae bacterium]|nr:polysaccharide deacetylase family protein [Defluviitaleaceae bacterium]MCL2238425.1 polysaccharide deacetylase family protein [Defluviitaleaceae bacterium]